MGPARNRKVSKGSGESVTSAEIDKEEAANISETVPTATSKKGKVARLKDSQSRGLTHYLLTAAKVLLAMLLIPPFLNYAALQKEISHLQGQGELYDIGWGQRLFLSCQGQGAPTVILEAPTGMNSDVWSLVVNKLAKLSKVCVYDRAGLGFSERPYYNRTDTDGEESKSNGRNRWKPFTAERMVDDLHRLITASSDQPKPFLLVGAELGAVVSQFYTHLYESEVIGLILINPLSDDIFLQDNGIWANNWFGHVIPSYQTIQLGAALGLTRLAVMLGLLQHPLHMADGLSADTVQRQKFLLCHPKHLSSVVDEHHFINDTFSQLRTVRMMRKVSQNVPVTVITGNYYDEQMPSALNKAWAKSEQNLISHFYPAAQHLVVNGGDRHMMYTHPSAIIEPVSRAIRQWRLKTQQKSQASR